MTECFTYSRTNAKRALIASFLVPWPILQMAIMSIIQSNLNYTVLSGCPVLGRHPVSGGRLPKSRICFPLIDVIFLFKVDTSI